MDWQDDNEKLSYGRINFILIISLNKFLSFNLLPANNRLVYFKDNITLIILTVRILCLILGLNK